ncbi:hypothetical protein D3C72_1838710 [compost metagenome]
MIAQFGFIDVREDRPWGMICRSRTIRCPRERVLVLHHLDQLDHVAGHISTGLTDAFFNGVLTIVDGRSVVILQCGQHQLDLIEIAGYATLEFLSNDSATYAL